MAEMEDAEDFAAVRPYSCAFAESVVSFFKKQSQFVHNVVRLCRAWAKVLYLSKPPFSLMYLVELVATHSAQQVSVASATRRPAQQQVKFQLFYGCAATITALCVSLHTPGTWPPLLLHYLL